MCTVSMVTDYWKERQLPQWPNDIIINPTAPTVTRQEFEDLKRELEALKELLIAAKKYDNKTGEPDCEKDENVQILKKLAKAFDIDLSDVFRGNPA